MTCTINCFFGIIGKPWPIGQEIDNNICIIEYAHLKPQSGSQGVPT